MWLIGVQIGRGSSSFPLILLAGLLACGSFGPRSEAGQFFRAGRARCGFFMFALQPPRELLLLFLSSLLLFLPFLKCLRSSTGHVSPIALNCSN
jgi:hypothetical protein